MRILLGMVAVILGLVLLILALPFLVDLNRYQAQYLPILEQALNRKVSIERIRLMIIPRLGARLQGLTVGEDPAFGSAPFASLRSLEIGVKLGPLLSGRVEVEEIALQDPAIAVIKNPAGRLNIATLGKKGAAGPAAPGPSPTAPPTEGPLRILAMLAVDDFSLTGGRLRYSDQSAGKPAEYELRDLELALKDVRLGQRPGLHVATEVRPFNLPVTVDGTFGPLQETPDLKDFDLALGVGRATFTLKGSAVGGTLKLVLTSPLIDAADLPVTLPVTKPVRVKDLQLIADAKYPLPEGVPPQEAINVRALGMALAFGASVVDLKGSALGGDLALTATSSAVNTADLPVALPLKRPVEFRDLLVAAGFKGGQARLDKLSVTVFGGQVKSSGTLALGTQPVPFTGLVVLEGLQLGPALDALGMNKVSISGTAATELDLRGRGFTLPELTRALEGTAHLSVRDGKIEGINVLKEVFALLKAVGIAHDVSDATVFSKIESNLSVKGGAVHVARLLVDSHDFLATGSGVIGFDQTLNLKANVSLSENLSRSIVGRSPLTRRATTKGRFSIPIVITGTAKAPSFALDTAALGAKVKEEVTETVNELMKGTPEDALRKGQDLLKGFLGR